MTSCEWHGTLYSGSRSGGQGTIVVHDLAQTCYDQGWRTLDIYVLPRTAGDSPVATITPGHPRVLWVAP